MSKNSNDLARQARFIFQGKVKKLKAATMPEIKDKRRTAIVHVNEIIQAPRILSNYNGQDITVKLNKGQRLKVGQEAIFYTNGWLSGNESAAVESLGHEPVKKAQAAMAMVTGGDPVQRLKERDLQTRLDDADMVVQGRVLAVRLPEETVAAMEAAGPTTRPPLSEHDPDWQEAVVEIDGVHKGSSENKSVIVRFPGSHDRMWSKSPKFRPGQQGVFLLHKARMGQDTQGRVSALAADSEEEGPEFFTTIHPDDFHPIENPGLLANLLSLPKEDENE